MVSGCGVGVGLDVGVNVAVGVGVGEGVWVAPGRGELTTGRFGSGVAILALHPASANNITLINPNTCNFMTAPYAPYS